MMKNLISFRYKTPPHCHTRKRQKKRSHTYLFELRRSGYFSPGIFDSKRGHHLRRLSNIFFSSIGHSLSLSLSTPKLLTLLFYHKKFFSKRPLSVAPTYNIFSIFHFSSGLPLCVLYSVFFLCVDFFCGKIVCSCRRENIPLRCHSTSPLHTLQSINNHWSTSVRLKLSKI